MFRSLVTRFQSDRRGGVAIMAAAFGMVMCGLAALAVDLGSISLSARRLQSTADLAALTAARDLDRAEAAARATANANQTNITAYKIEKGRYVADKSLRPDQRFTVQSTDVNAARVELTAPAPLYFGRWILRKDTVQITRKATAALPGGTGRAMFTIGSRLLKKDEGILNALLSALLGSNVSLSAVDYETLVNTDINLLTFSNALATNLGVAAGDYDALLKHDVTAGQVLKVLEVVGSADSRSILSRLTSIPLTAKFKVQDLIGVEAGAREGLKQGLDADVNLMRMLMATLQTGTGTRQVALDLGLQAGLARIDAVLGVGERPNNSAWVTITNKGTPVLYTNQIRLYLKVETAQVLAGLAKVTVPILIEIAPSSGRLAEVQCRPNPLVTLEGRPGVAHIRVGTVPENKIKDFTTNLAPAEAEILSALLGTVKIMAKADVKISDLRWQKKTFTQAQIGSGEPQTVTANGLVSGLFESLLRDLNARIVVIGIPLINLSSLLGDLDILLVPVGKLLDIILHPLLNILGIGLGQVDLWANAVECPQTGRGPILVG